jgi:hypothetical protein
MAEKDRASRWATAWGLIAGILAKGIRLKSADVLRQGEARERGGGRDKWADLTSSKKE